MRKMKDSGIEWIGKCPSNWNMIPTKYLFQVVSGATPQADQYENWDGDIIWITPADFKTDDRNVSKGKRTLTQKGFNSCSTTLIPAGSLIFSKRAPIGAVVVNSVDLCTNQGCLSSIPYNSNLTCVRYFYYVMAVATDQYELLGSGTTFKEISATNFSNFVLPVPAYEEQQQIATYLDTRCAQVDTLIANVQAQIEKLKAYKQSLITEVVTRGLDPSVPMKDRGVEWIGKIPAHWEITRIKNLFVLRNERNFKPLDEVNLISLYTDLGVVQHSELTETTGNRAVNADGYKLVYERDIVVNIILCWMGAIGMSKYNGVTSPAYDVYKPKENVFSEYYHYLFRTKAFNGECYRYGRGIMMMRWRTYSTEFSAISVPLPPEDEQRTIVAYLDDRCRRVDQLIAIKQAKIDKLNEYKKSLIYEYVTGKKEA